MKKQTSRINLGGKKISRKKQLRLDQENADNELVLKYFFGAIIFFSIIAVIIFSM